MKTPSSSANGTPRQQNGSRTAVVARRAQTASDNGTIDRFVPATPRLGAGSAVAESAFVRRPLLLTVDNLVQPLLIQAADQGDVRLVRSLIASGAEINRPFAGATPLFHAVSRGHANVVQELAQNQPNFEAPNLSFQYTALMRAAVMVRPDLVTILLAHGALPHTERGGETALSLALQTAEYCEDAAEVVSLLKQALAGCPTSRI